MWFTESGVNEIGRINFNFNTNKATIQQFPIDSTNTGEPEGIAVGPDNNLWFTLAKADEIGVMSTAGVTLHEYGPLAANAAPESIAIGPAQGAMWFTEPGANQIGTINTAGKITEYPASGSNPIPSAITAVPGGSIWYVGSNASGIESFASGTSTAYSYTTTQTDSATAITADANGNLWFTQQSDNQVGVLNPVTGISTEFALPAGSTGPLGIALGADGKLWFTESESNQIGMIDPSSDQISEFSAGLTPNAGLDQIVSDPVDGNLYFTEKSANQIGRINRTTKVITEFPLPRKNAEPTAIAVDNSGNIWFTESNVNRIAELSPSDPSQMTEYPVAAAPYGITAGPDGNIWFTEYGYFAAGVLNGEPAGNYYAIAKVNPTSGLVICQYPVSGGSSFGAITAGPGQTCGSPTVAHRLLARPDRDDHDKRGRHRSSGRDAKPVAITWNLVDGNIWFTGTGLGSSNPNVIGIVPLSAAATPTQLAVTIEPPNSITAGKGFGLVVTVENSAGIRDLYYGGTVSLALRAALAERP